MFCETPTGVKPLSIKDSVKTTYNLFRGKPL